MAVKDAWQYPLRMDSDEKSETREKYESRLMKQVPPEAMAGATGSGFELFSYRNQMRGRAAMLVYFFDHHLWWIRNSVGEQEPARRQMAAFAGVARVAEKKRNQLASDEAEPGPGGNGMRLRMQAN